MFYTFDELKGLNNKKEEIGNKAHYLVHMMHLGFPVPKGAVITSDGSEKEIVNYLSLNRGKLWAVRSSAALEDLEDASFAGQYDSILRVGEEDVIREVKKCFASMKNNRVLEYCKNNNMEAEDAGLSVIIQEMAVGEKSGIAFSVDPVGGGDKTVIIEATHGTGEKVADGTTTPDYYSYHWHEEKIVKQTGTVLSLEEVAKLARIVIDIQVELGLPVDVEWTMKRDAIYILQVRPITKIQYQDIKGEWTTANFKDGGVARTVCHPLMWSIYDMVWEGLSYDYIRKLGLIGKGDAPLFADVFYGRPYWNVGEMKASLLKMPGFVEKDYDEQLGLEKPYVGEGRTSKMKIGMLPRAVRAMVRVGRWFKEQEKFGPAFKEKQYKRLKELDAIDLAHYETEDLYRFWKEFIQREYYTNEYLYFWHIYIITVYQTVFFRSLSRYATTSEILNLVIGLKGISHLMPNFELWDISRQIKENKDESDFVKKGYLNDFISKYKHLSPHEIDITVPRYDEDAAHIIETVRMYLNLDDSFDPRKQEEKQNKAYKKQYDRFMEKVPGGKKNKVKKQIETMRSYLWWREELRDLSIRYYYYVRKFTMALAQNLKDNGYVECLDDVYYLCLEDVLDIIGHKKSKEDIKVILTKNKRYYKSFRNFKNKNEIGSIYVNGKSTNKDKDSLSGVTCSDGRATGTARVIGDVKDIANIREGDILIVKYLDPAWTSKFGIIKGIVSEGGGILSHAAVIAREYGIPAIMGVKDATTRIGNGQEITINGHEGKILITAVKTGERTGEKC